MKKLEKNDVVSTPKGNGIVSSMGRQYSYVLLPLDEPNTMGRLVEVPNVDIVSLETKGTIAEEKLWNRLVWKVNYANGDFQSFTWLGAAIDAVLAVRT